jgi:MFS family permease
VREVLVDPPVRRAVAAFACITTADWAVTVAVGVLAFEDGGAGQVGLIAMARMVPSAFVVPVVSVIADRIPRERILAAVALIQAVMMGAAAALVASGAPRGWVYVAIVASTVANTITRPAHSALLPHLCSSTAELASATVATGLLGALAALFGPVLTGVLLAVAGADAVFAACAGLCALGVAALVRIRYDKVHPTAGPRPHVGREVAEGLGIVARHRELRTIYAGVVAQTYVRGALNVLMVVVAFDVLHTRDSGTAALAAAFGVGGIVGSFAGSLLAGSPTLGRWLLRALVAWGVPIGLTATTDLSAVAFALVALVGVANSVVDVPFFTLPVRLVEDTVLGRVFGVFESLVALGVAAGSAATPALISAFGVHWTLVVTSAVLPVYSVVAWRRLAAMDDRLAVRDREIGVLRAAPMFGVLPVSSIERLATHVTPISLGAGTTIVAQGEPADVAYVIASGEAEVTGDGIVLRQMGPGDTVGEIALLRGGVRTATVRATTDVELLEMGRDAFLDAVTGHRGSNEVVTSLVDARLGHFRPSGG